MLSFRQSLRTLAQEELRDTHTALAGGPVCSAQSGGGRWLTPETQRWSWLTLRDYLHPSSLQQDSFSLAVVL